VWNVCSFPACGLLSVLSFLGFAELASAEFNRGACIEAA
jgi:hypothetical protein